MLILRWQVAGRERNGWTSRMILCLRGNLSRVSCFVQTIITGIIQNADVIIPRIISQGDMNGLYQRESP